MRGIDRRLVQNFDGVLFGLVAAHHFVEAGLNTVIFEASDQIGGCWRTQAMSTTLRHSLPRGS